MVRLINNNCVDFIVGDCRGPAFRTAFMSIGAHTEITTLLHGCYNLVTP